MYKKISIAVVLCMLLLTGCNKFNPVTFEESFLSVSSEKSYKNNIDYILEHTSSDISEDIKKYLSGNNYSNNVKVIPVRTNSETSDGITKSVSLYKCQSETYCFLCSNYVFF